MSIIPISANLRVEIDKLALLSEADYHDLSAQKASELGLDINQLDALWKSGREKHLKQMGAKSARAFFEFGSIEGVRGKLDALEAEIAKDLAFVYEDSYLQAAAALEHFNPGEFARLANKLKSKGLRSVDRWESTVRKDARLEAERIKEHRSSNSFAGGHQSQGVDDDKPLIVLTDITPAVAPVVDAPALFDNIKAFIRRFVILTRHQLVAVTLWIVFTHVFEIADVSPRLALLSPKKRCGKSTMERVLGLLCPRTLPASNISPSAIFRAIDALHPVLLLDEVDAFAGRQSKPSEKAEEIRGLLNSGHTPDAAYVIRSEKVGDRWEARRFSTWAPICYAAIGRLPDTWEDRSIIVQMKRRLKSEKVTKLTRRNLRTIRLEAEALVAQLARWAKDNLDALRQAEPKIPAGLDDRAEDNWDLLLAISDLVSPDWGKAARAAAVALSAGRDRDDDAGLDIRLLSDIKSIIEELNLEETTPIGSVDLCKWLVALGDEAPWASMPKSKKPLSTTMLARMLRPFEVYPKHTDFGNEYDRSQLEDAFLRYLKEEQKEGDKGDSNTPEDTSSDPPPPDPMSESVSEPFNPSGNLGEVGRNGDFEPFSET